MAASSRRAVLTGIGLLTPIGKDPAAFWDALMAGRSGVKPIKAFDTSGLPVRFGGEMPDFDAKQYVDKKDRRNLKMMARTIQLAVSVAQLALLDGKVDKDKLDKTRFGCEFGSGMIASELEELADCAQASSNCQAGWVDLEKWGDNLGLIQPLWMLKYLPNMLACQVSILHDAQGPNNTVTENEVAGIQALGEAYRILTRGEADLFLVGGADSKMNPLSMVRQSLFARLSRRNDSPEKACRPFDRHRDGIVLGEGGACFVLEELEHAKNRGARIYGEVVGFAAGFDLKRNGAGIARVLRQALNDAGIGPEDVDHVNAQGFGDVHADIWEAKGIREVFGSCTPAVPVFAAKGYFGNLGAGGGLVELAASLLGLQHGTLPPSLNYEEADPECPIPVVAGTPRATAHKHVLKLSFTELGQCAAVVVRKWE